MSDNLAEGAYAHAIAAKMQSDLALTVLLCVSEPIRQFVLDGMDAAVLVMEQGQGQFQGVDPKVWARARVLLEAQLRSLRSWPRTQPRAPEPGPQPPR